VTAEEVKIGVGNWNWFMRMMKSLEKLVQDLERLESKEGECDEYRIELQVGEYERVEKDNFNFSLFC